MKKVDIFALANTFGLIDLFLHPLFHLWGWFSPHTYEAVMSEFVIGLHVKVMEHPEPKFFIYWIIEAMCFWLLGLTGGYIYNKLSK